MSVLTIGIRGAGKTTVDDFAFFLREYQSEQDKIHEKALKTHEIKIRIHKIKVRLIDKFINQCVNQGKDYDDYERDQEELQEKEPRLPKEENVLIQDATLAGILEVLNKGIPVTTISIAEAERFFW